jgi:gliding motility-associated-like protein
LHWINNLLIDLIILEPLKKIITLFIVLSLTKFGFSQTANFTYSPTCFGSQTILSGSSTLADTAVAMWQWDVNGDGVYDFNNKLISYFFTAMDSVAVKLKVTPNFGTPDSVTKFVVIHPLPNVDFRADNLCALSAAKYINMSSITSGSIVSSSNLWDFNNDGTPDLTGGDTVYYTCGAPQTYITRLTCVSDKGCSAFATKTTTVYPVPVADCIISDTCLGSSTLFHNISTITSPDYFSWNFGDGNQVSTDALSTDATHVYAYTGAYTAKLIAVSIQGCRDTANFNFQIHHLPDLSITTRGGTTFYEGGSIGLIANSTSAISYLWNTTETTDSIHVTQAGGYFVTATDANSCKALSGVNITKSEVPDLVTVSSNILTPNGDGINDYLIIDNKEAYKECRLQVYNAWNDLVYSVDGYNNDWDGRTSAGNALPDGAYYYLITCDSKEMLKGTINILLKDNTNSH